MTKIDLNCDLGESFGSYTLGQDEALLPYVSSVNIACGWHGGDPNVMEKTILLAKKFDVNIGAHPGYPDLLGFGRRGMDISENEVRTYLLYQVGALSAIAQANGTQLSHVKLHGAFYNQISQNRTKADAVAHAIWALDRHLVVYALAGSELVSSCRRKGLTVAEEVFADRAYHEDGSLVDRKLSGAVLHDMAIVLPRVLKMVQTKKVTAIEGVDVAIHPDTICLHGDTPESVDFARHLNTLFVEHGISKMPFGKQEGV